MLPQHTAITSYLAMEYHHLLRGTTLARTEYCKADKQFRFFFGTRGKSYLEFSFAPSHFLLQEGWQIDTAGFEIWQECRDARIDSVTGSRQNRVITFELVTERDHASPMRYQIVFELFGALANAYLLNDQSRIMHATRVIRDSRLLRPGKQYLPPESTFDFPLSGEVAVATRGNCRYLLKFDEQEHVVVPEGESPQELDARAPLVSLYRMLHKAEAEEGEFAKRFQRALTALKRELQKKESVLSRLEADLQECGEAEKFRQWGDILMSNPQARKSHDRVTLFDFYHEKEVDIPVIPGQTLTETAAKYYKHARKLERAPESIRPRIEKVRESIASLQASLEKLKLASDANTLNELVRTSGISLDRRQTSTRDVNVESAVPYRAFRSSAGERILVGKSAKGNDELTFKVARSYDYWFHAQQATGSHVILAVADKNKPPSKRSILEAARLAAYYSQMRKSTHVPVIYTERRHVRKAKDGVAGKVIPQQVKSIFVDPALPPEKDTPDRR